MISNCTITGNFAADGGGICCDVQSSPTLVNCAIVENAGQLGGGMSCWWNSNPRLTACTFNQNRSQDKGGAMYNFESNPELTNCTFSGNRAIDGGGMFNALNSHPILTNCVFTGNWVWPPPPPRWEGHAGGIHSKNRDKVLTDNAFTADTTYLSGAGVYNENSSPTLTNCIFSGNSAYQDGGGMWNGNNSSPTLINCAFSQNLAGRTTGGVFNEVSSSPVLANCILWGNTDSGRPTEPAQIQGGTPVINYCCVQGWTGRLGGSGNIRDDPLFKDPDGPDDIVGTQDDDLRLSAGSACIDAGDNTAIPSGVVTDLSGNPRFFDDPATVDTGNGTAPIVDMGPYEFQSVCGDPDHPYPPGDLNQDCRVNFLDIAVIANNWLACTAPECD